MNRAKVFGVGLNKTGTTTLKLVFERLGYRHLSRTPRLFKLWKMRAYNEIFAYIDDFESFEDWPWPLMVPELIERYPQAKFVLTRRSSPQIWVESLKRQAERTNPDNNPRKTIYGRHYPHGHEQEHIDYYSDHIERVRALFESEPDRLVELCWDDGDSWKEICSFLDKRAPWSAFPHANKSAASGSADPEFLLENQRRIKEKLRYLRKN